MPSPDRPPTLDVLLAESAWIRALARSLVVDPGTADDVVQDATVVALTNPPSKAGAVRGWLRRVVRNLASNARRGESRRSAREQAVAAPDATESAADVVARWEIRRGGARSAGAVPDHDPAALLRGAERRRGGSADRRAARDGADADATRTRPAPRAPRAPRRRARTARRGRAAGPGATGHGRRRGGAGVRHGRRRRGRSGHGGLDEVARGGGARPRARIGDDVVGARGRRRGRAQAACGRLDGCRRNARHLEAGAAAGDAGRGRVRRRDRPRRPRCVRPRTRPLRRRARSRRREIPRP
jgi:DNA-directed RNA polymerase specialized sigma24 family protein